LTEESVIYFTNCSLQNIKEIKVEETNKGRKTKDKEKEIEKQEIIKKLNKC
jgi:hypothetical protein